MEILKWLAESRNVDDLYDWGWNLIDEELDAVAESDDTMTEYDKKKTEVLQKFKEQYDITDYDTEIMEKLNNVELLLVLMRGRPVTREQTMKLFTDLEPLFFEPDEDHDLRKCAGLLNDVLYKEKHSGLGSWLFQDGTIGASFRCYNKFLELAVPKFRWLAEQYKFLDMVVSVNATYDEDKCFRCRGRRGIKKKLFKNCKCKDCQPYLKKFARLARRGYWYKPGDFAEGYFGSWLSSHTRSDAKDGVVMTIWLHEGRADVLFGEKASEKYEEYNSLYSDPEYEYMFGDSVCAFGGTNLYSKEFVEDCFEFIGKSRETCDKYIEQEILLPFHYENILTKAWAIQQYRKYIRG